MSKRGLAASAEVETEECSVLEVPHAVRDGIDCGVYEQVCACVYVCVRVCECVDKEMLRGNNTLTRGSPITIASGNEPMSPRMIEKPCKAEGGVYTYHAPEQTGSVHRTLTLFDIPVPAIAANLRALSMRTAAVANGSKMLPSRSSTIEAAARLT
jgi:hypothetical protein